MIRLHYYLACAADRLVLVLAAIGRTVRGER